MTDTFLTVCTEGAISPAVSKDLGTVDQDAIGCAEVVMRVAIVVTAESTQWGVVDARRSDADKVRPNRLHSHAEGGTKDDAVNAAVVDLDSVGCWAEW